MGFFSSKTVLLQHSPSPVKKKLCPTEDELSHSQSDAQKSHQVDITGPDYPWHSILSYLNSKELLNVALVNRDLYSYAMDESLWRILVLKKLKLDVFGESHFRLNVSTWKSIYVQLLEEVHSYRFRQVDKHIDWMRIGGFTLASGSLTAADSLVVTANFSTEQEYMEKNPPAEEVFPSSWDFNEAKCGVWITDLHLVRCPICNLDSCEGTMQVLEARHIELFFLEEWKVGTLQYEAIGSHRSPFNCVQAAACIYDKEKIVTQPESKDIFDTKSWTAPAGDWTPRGMSRKYSVAASTNLQDNDGLSVKCEALKFQNEVIGLRISQQLL